MDVEGGRLPQGAMEGLTATNLAFKLPCSNACIFGRTCMTMYAEGVCTAVIEKFIRDEVFGTPGPKELLNGTIGFTTENPPGRVSISDGSVRIARSYLYY